MVSLRQLHWIDLCSLEWDFRGLAHCSLDLFNDGVSVTLVFSKQEWCGVVTTLELSAWIQSATSLGLRHLGL